MTINRMMKLAQTWVMLGEFSADTRHLYPDVDKNIQQRGFAGRHRPNY